MNGRTGSLPRLRWLQLPALGIATLVVLCGVAAVVLAFSKSIIPDFVDFWAAGRLASEGHAATAYDMAAHHAIEAQVAPTVGVLPFPYPPFVLPVLVPFGMLPFWLGFGLWIAIGGGVYLGATRNLLPARFSLGQAAAAANFITGQNGFITSAIFIGGTKLLTARPFAGGAILGLLCFKPQLAILLPLALLAGREWRAIAGGLASSFALVALSLLLFGPDSYAGFFANLPRYSQWLGTGRWPWGELATLFALLRSFGVANGPAMAIQLVAAAGGAALTIRAWWLGLEQRVPILAAATLLAAPYLFTYDALLLSVPLAWVGRHDGDAKFAIIWLLSLIPALSYFSDVPNTIPLAAMLALWALHSRRTAEPKEAAGKAAYQV